MALGGKRLDGVLPPFAYKQREKNLSWMVGVCLFLTCLTIFFLYRMVDYYSGSSFEKVFL